MRHAPFVIGEREHDAWLTHMREAVDEIGLPEQLDKMLWDYLVMAAKSMIRAAMHHRITPSRAAMRQ